MNFEIITGSPKETMEFGAVLGQQLRGGEVISLVGNLGAGKTHLIKGIVSGVCEEDADAKDFVNSPTFVLINEYLAGRLDLYHIDAYRLDSVEDFERLGFDDLCYDSSVVLVEWADKVESALKGLYPIRINLYHESENQRKICISNLPDYIEL